MSLGRASWSTISVPFLISTSTWFPPILHRQWPTRTGLELSAEAALDGKEAWTEAQASLYQQVGCQLKSLWTNGHKPTENHAETHADDQPPETPEHYCQEYQTPFKRYRRGESVWWSHKTVDGKWCREK